MSLILIRHGETEMNALHKKRPLFNGQAETPLTSNGELQAVEVGRQLAANADLKIKLAVSSTIQRSIHTAKLVMQELPSPLQLHLSDGLRERSLGIFEGKFIEDVFAEYPQYRDDPAYKYFRAHFSQKAPGGENLTEVTDRAWAALKEFEEQCDGDLLIFSHATTIRCLPGKALALTEEQITTLDIPNASPIFLEKAQKGYQRIG